MVGLVLYYSLYGWLYFSMYYILIQFYCFVVGLFILLQDGEWDIWMGGLCYFVDLFFMYIIMVYYY